MLVKVVNVFLLKNKNVICKYSKTLILKGGGVVITQHIVAPRPVNQKGSTF